MSISSEVVCAARCSIRRGNPGVHFLRSSAGMSDKARQEKQTPLVSCLYSYQKRRPRTPALKKSRSRRKAVNVQRGCAFWRLRFSYQSRPIKATWQYRAVGNGSGPGPQKIETSRAYKRQRSCPRLSEDRSGAPLGPEAGPLARGAPRSSPGKKVHIPSSHSPLPKHNHGPKTDTHHRKPPSKSRPSTISSILTQIVVAYT